MKMADIESRFKEVTGLTHLDLSKEHFEKGDEQQQKTTREEAREFGYVTTPIWLVDEMVESHIKTLTPDSTTCDACCGCGQFSIRIMRKFWYHLVKRGIDQKKAEIFMVEHWLKKNHWFTEFQFSTIAKLIYIFGPDINVYVGDSLNLKYSGDSDYGILFFSNKSKRWFNIPGLKEILAKEKDNLKTLEKAFKHLEQRINGN